MVEEIDLDQVPVVTSVFHSHLINEEDTGEILSAHPHLIEAPTEKLESDFAFWESLLDKQRDIHHHVTMYPSAAFYTDENLPFETYQTNRLEIAKILSSEVGLNPKMISRIIAGCPEFFGVTPTYVNSQLKMLQSFYDLLGGKNFKVFCRVQLGQSIRLLDRPETLGHLTSELKKLNFTTVEILKILPKELVQIQGEYVTLDEKRVG